VGFDKQPYNTYTGGVYGDDVKCVMKYGRDPVPVRIFVTRFDTIAVNGAFELIFSNIRLPNYEFSTPKVRTYVK
jgi:hypothetical protein